MHTYDLKHKPLNKFGIERNVFNLIKNIYKVSTANIRLNGKILEAFPPRSGTKARMSSLITAFQHHIRSPIYYSKIRKRH